MGHIVFNKLLAIMEEKGVTTYRIRKGKSITTDSIAALCEVLNCQPGDIKGGPCKVFPAPFAVFLQLENDNNDTKSLEPDISVICDKNKIDNHGCHGAPDWTIEIVSPCSKPMDYYTKLALYREAGVREYWIVDPLRQIILVYDMEHVESPVIHSFNDS